MAIATEDIFKHCAPAVRTNIGTCGTVTLCNSTKPATADELDTLFKSDGDYRILEALFMTQMETKACGAVQNSWEDFFKANMRVAKGKQIQLESQERTLTKIRPFILANQKRPINNVYWRVSNGGASGGNWAVKVQSKSGIPADVRSFTPGERVYIESAAAGGGKNWWQGVVVTSTLNGEYVDLVLDPQNDGTAFDDVENPVTGILRRGSANVGKSEKYCDNEPGYINNSLIEFWLEHTKFTLCSSDEYSEFRTFVAANNPLFRTFYDLPEIEENRQRTQAFWSKWFNNLMFGRPISANQNLNQYNLLPQIENFASSSGLGFGGGRCAGYKANTIGWLEQLKRCGRIYDAQGAQLDLWSLMDAIYSMMRVRMGVGSAAATSFDLFTDSMTAEAIDRAFILLFKDVSADTLRLTQDITRGKNEAFGFQFSSYRLRGKTNGVTLNVITHFGLDDYLAEWNDAGDEDQGRAIWLLDMTTLYPAVIESTRKTLTTGKLADLAAVDEEFTCVEETFTKTVTQVGVTYAAVLECPASSLLIYNFSSEVPEHELSEDRVSYLPTVVGESYY